LYFFNTFYDVKVYTKQQNLIFAEFFNENIISTIKNNQKSLYIQDLIPKILIRILADVQNLRDDYFSTCPKIIDIVFFWYFILYFVDRKFMGINRKIKIFTNIM